MCTETFKATENNPCSHSCSKEDSHNQNNPPLHECGNCGFQWLSVLWEKPNGW